MWMIWFEQDYTWDKVISLERPNWITRSVFGPSSGIGSGEPTVISGPGQTVLCCWQQQHEWPACVSRGWKESSCHWQGKWAVLPERRSQDQLYRLPGPHQCCSVCLWPGSSRAPTPRCWPHRCSQVRSRLWGGRYSHGHVPKHGWLSCTPVRWLWGSQLRKMLIIRPSFLKNSTMYQNFWVCKGLQVFPERQGKWKATTHSQEFMKSIRRYYSNTITDGEKQDAMNLYVFSPCSWNSHITMAILSSRKLTVFLVLYLFTRFLGHFQPQQGRPDLWELESDYYLHVGGRGEDSVSADDK